MAFDTKMEVEKSEGRRRRQMASSSPGASSSVVILRSDNPTGHSESFMHFVRHKEKLAMRKRAAARWGIEQNINSEPTQIAKRWMSLDDGSDHTQSSRSSLSTGTDIPRAPQRKRSPKILISHKRRNLKPLASAERPRAPQRTKSPLLFSHAMVHNRQVNQSLLIGREGVDGVEQDGMEQDESASGKKERKSSKEPTPSKNDSDSLTVMPAEKSLKTSFCLPDKSIRSLYVPKSATHVRKLRRHVSLTKQCALPSVKRRNSSSLRMAKLAGILPSHKVPQKSSSFQCQRSTHRFGPARSSSLPTMLRLAQ